MASVRRAPSGHWRAEWREASGRKRSKTFRRQADARRFLTTLEADALRGLYIDPSAGRVTLSAHWRDYHDREQHRLQSSTLRLYETFWRLHLEPRLGERRLSGITRADVEHLIGALLAEGRGVTTTRGVYKLTRRLLEVAVAQDRLGRNPARGLALPRPLSRSERALTAEEVWKLADAVESIEGRWRAAIVLMGFCGPRIGEVAGLQPERVDFLRRRIHITEQIVEVAGQLHRSPTKTGERRALPAPAIVLEELAEHMRLYPPREGLVFTGRDGGPLRRNVWRRRVFAPAAEAAGLSPLTPHDLRHTAITLAIAAGADLKIVQAIAGHSSAAVTADVYAHLLPSASDAIATRMDEVARGAQAANRRQEAPNGATQDHAEVARVVGLSRENGETSW